MKAKILWNSKKKWAVNLSRELDAFLKKKKVKTVKKNADFTVVIGGDGTILYNKDKFEGPVLAIGSKKSFVCQCSNEDWEQPVAQFISNPKYEERVMLQVQFRKKKFLAINDVAMLSKFHKVLTISVDIGGDEYCFDADGVVVSTPTGSTAYAYAAGGPVMEPTLEALSIVPIAPDKRLFDPVIVSAGHRISLSSGTQAHIVIDGGKTLPGKKRRKGYNNQRLRKKIKFAIR